MAVSEASEAPKVKSPWINAWSDNVAGVDSLS